MKTATLDDRLHAMLETRKGKGTFRSLKKHLIRENSDQPDAGAKIDFVSLRWTGEVPMLTDISH
jgi:hypothetical protein